MTTMNAIAVAVVTIAVIALLAGLGLSYASRALPADDGELIEQVNKLLPQTQCAQCGYAGCRPYAKAIINDNTAINLCPPGGEDTIKRLAELLGRDEPRDELRDDLPLAQTAAIVRAVANIDESLCIGCLHCRNACPVDAIVGAQHRMHTVIESECTGCELCIAPCPVDCISLRRVA